MNAAYYIPAPHSFSQAIDYPVTLNFKGHPTAFYVRLINQLLDDKQEKIMAKQGKSPRNGGAFAEISFVQYRLNAQEKKDFSEWKEKEAARLEDLLVMSIEKGYKMSVSWDETHQCFIGSMTCKEESSPNHNMCMTSRDSQWYSALLMNVYKTNVLCDGGLWSDLGDNTELG